jgi:hypothetical protein
MTKSRKRKIVVDAAIHSPRSDSKQTKNASAFLIDVVGISAAVIIAIATNITF